MSSGTKLLTCYNRGCGQDFDPAENTEKSCTYHPDAPYFHDAYKIWNCCKKKCIDFTEFLNIKGCKTSFHSNVKPPEPVKTKEELLLEEKPKEMAKSLSAPMRRPDINAQPIVLRKEVSPALSSTVFNAFSGSDNGQSTAEVVGIGTPCKNSGCTVSYQGPQSDSEECVFHPGGPVFHEGLKFWSCCTKRTTEFSEFLAQKGCSKGLHLWVKQGGSEETQTDLEGNRLVICRYDWMQTGREVNLIIYGKKYHPEKSTVRANGVKVFIQLYFPEENSYFKKEIILAGIIEPENSYVSMSPSKCEIKLRKAEPISWRDLEISLERHQKNEELEEYNQPKNVGVEPVELDDL